MVYSSSHSLIIFRYSCVNIYFILIETVNIYLFQYIYYYYYYFGWGMYFYRRLLETGYGNQIHVWEETCQDSAGQYAKMKLSPS